MLAQAVGVQDVPPELRALYCKAGSTTSLFPAWQYPLPSRGQHSLSLLPQLAAMSMSVALALNIEGAIDGHHAWTKHQRRQWERETQERGRGPHRCQKP